MEANVKVGPWRFSVKDRFRQLTGLCPGSNVQVGSQGGLRVVACQACNRTVGVNPRGVIHSHYKGSFHYLNTRGDSGALVYTGLESRGTENELHWYFNFEVGGSGTERVVARMALPLNELKRLHGFLGSAISDIEQACASSPAFYAQVKRTDDYMKDQHSSPHIMY